ncbi:MAG: PhzF family phenazine biosynthesis protein [Parvibaculaceae bacterium]|nr:PhzF family phenazine biosynthesis protein [Parvibaculaceae bacterium]
MELHLFQVDAFADTVFGGNPAAIVPLKEWLSVETMQALAAENNLAETAFFVPEGEGFRLRWFTPTVEVELCGHATLATAHVLFTHLGWDKPEIKFQYGDGELTVTKQADGMLEMDFPARPMRPTIKLDGLDEALGDKPIILLKGVNLMAVFEHPQQIADLSPNVYKLAQITGPMNVGLIATAACSEEVEFDFVSRFFAPAHGINEDPVTGSAHCDLTPYWAKRLKKNTLKARQISKRGGTVLCELRGDRVFLRGQCADYLKGTFTV